jgi:hypothetical protein
MQRHVLGSFLITASVAFAQLAPTNEADRAALPTPQSSDGFVVKTLRVFGPFERTPLTEKERFRLYVANTVGFPTLAGEAVSAAYSQAIDSPHEWGQGMTGYGKRFASNMGYNAVRQTISYAASIPLHEDNRYFGSGRETVKGRIMYALASPLIAHKPNGRATFSFSAAAGLAGAAVIPRYWYPPSWRGIGNAFPNAGWTYAGTAAANLFREFVPDIIRRIKHQ